MPDLDKKLFNHLTALSEKHSFLSEDLAVALISSGYPQEAASVLESRLDTDSKKWVYLEALIESEQFFLCLTEVDRLFPHPEAKSVLDTSYMKARAYLGLKEYNKARRLLKHISKLMPGYRLTQSLLLSTEKKERA